MERRSGSSRRPAIVVGGATLLTVAVLAVVATLRPPLPLPVTIDLRGLGTAGLGDRTPLAEVAGRAAVLVPATLAGLGLLSRRLPLPLVDLVAAPIAVFLVAQLNGVTDVGALVLTYACAAGAGLLRLLPDPPPGSRPLHRWYAAMLGIVPWGVIALHQVGQILAGSDPAFGVRVTTLTVLAATIVEFVVAWRRPALLPWAALVALPGLLLAALGVLAVR